jgi:hypothetical protein
MLNQVLHYKEVWGRVSTAPCIPYLNTTCTCVCDQLHVPAALTPGKKASVPNEEALKIWARRGGEDKNFCSYRESNFGYPAHKLVTILTYSDSCFELDRWLSRYNDGLRAERSRNWGSIPGRHKTFISSP